MPFVTCFVASRTWAEINSAPGRYDFSFFDQEIDRAVAAGNKGIAIRVRTNFGGLGPGATANPSWLYSDQVPPGPCRKRVIHERDGEFTAYEPWIARTWQRPYEDVMTALAAKYDTHPRVYAVVVTGFNFKHDELVADNQKVAGNWDNPSPNGVDFTEAQEVDRIKETLAMMDRVWPNTLKLWRGTSLNIPRGTPTPYDVFDATAAEIRSVYGDRVSVGDTGLNDVTEPTEPDYAHIKNAQGTRHHFQVGRSPQSPEACLAVGNLAVAAGAHHLEVGPLDWPAPAFNAAWEEVSRLPWAT
jgi:hypothetical protein